MKYFLCLSRAGIVAFVLAAAILTNGCSRGKSAKPVAGVPVLVAQAVETNMPVRIDPPPFGHVTPISTVTIHSQIGGIISEVHFKEGQEVKKGEPLFTIDPRPSQAALNRDKAQLENTEIQFNREQKLFDQKLVSQDEYDTSRAARDTLAATVQSDELNLGFCEIRAPLDGRTGGLQSFAGNVVKAPDDVLLTINQIHPIYVAFAVPEQYLPEIQRQMNGKPLDVTATYENLDGPPPQGKLTFIDNAVDMTTGTILLKATFPNEDNALWPGQFVQVTLTLSELTNAVVVPSQAVQTGQNGQFIYVVKPNPTNATLQTVEERSVTTGITYQNETVVKHGVQAGETVVTDGQLRLVPGVTVNIKSPVPPAAAASVTNAP
jgi:multidrug efflux system membrane fusion protein